MSTEENKAAERRFYEEVWNKHNPDTVDELVAPDLVEHNPVLPGQGPGREGFKQSVETTLATFPDAQITIQELIAEGDKVALRWTAHGMQPGRVHGETPHQQAGHRRGDRHLPLRGWQASGDLASLGHPGPHAAAWRHPHTDPARGAWALERVSLAPA